MPQHYYRAHTEKNILLFLLLRLDVKIRDSTDACDIIFFIIPPPPPPRQYCFVSRVFIFHWHIDIPLSLSFASALFFVFHYFYFILFVTSKYNYNLNGIEPPLSTPSRSLSLSTNSIFHPCLYQPPPRHPIHNSVSTMQREPVNYFVRTSASRSVLYIYVYNKYNNKIYRRLCIIYICDARILPFYERTFTKLIRRAPGRKRTSRRLILFNYK